MKTLNRYLAAALCGGSLVLASHAEKVRIEQLPVEVRDKIRAQTGGAQIEDIDTKVENGRIYYQVGFKRNGEQAELWFDQTGQLQNTGAAANLTPGKVSYAELPPVVKRIVDARLKGAQPNDIDRKVRNGEVSYEIGFKKDDQQHELLVSQDGRILRDIELSDSSLAIAQATTDFNSERAQLSGKKKVEFAQLPAEVQRTVARASKGARVEDIEVGQWRARNIYEVAFKDQGQHIELQVAENGRIFFDPRRINQPRAAGAPAGAIRGAAASVYPDVTSAVQLSSGQKVELQAVPAAVRQTVNREAPGAKIEDVERGAWRGMNVYEFGFKDAQGQHVELQVDANGNVVFDPRKNRK
mgnify:CR=1 FL=1